MIWFPVAACVALLGAILARLTIPTMYRRQLRLVAFEAEIAAEAQALEQARQMLAALDAEIRNIDARFVSLGHEIPRLKEDLGDLRRRPVWPAREIVLSEAETARVYIARLERDAGTGASVWAVPNFVLIYADNENAAVAAAMQRYPAVQGYRLAFATTSFATEQRHRDRSIKFAPAQGAPTPAALSA
jgi:hypothetical protein